MSTRYAGVVALLGLLGLSGSLGMADPMAPTWPQRIQREYPLDPTIDPCDDFYAHVCSKVIAGFELPANQSAYLFAAMDATSYLLGAYRSYLTELLQRPPRNPHERMLKPFYQGCMNPRASAADERRLVARVLSEMDGITSREAFQRLIGRHIDSGETAFLMLETLPNQEDPDQEDIVISSDLATLPERSYYHDPAVMADFRTLVEQFFQTIGMPDAGRRAAELAAFEQGFAETFPSAIELRTIELNRSRILPQELLRRDPALSLAELLARLPQDAVIRDLTPANYAYLEQVLEEYPLKRLKDIYRFNALSAYLDDGYPEYLQAKLTFSRKHLGAPPERPDREQRCSDLMSSLFDAELDAELQPRLFPDFPRDRVVDLVERVRQSALQTLRDNTWLSATGKAGAVDKLERMRLLLVGPQTPAEWDFVLPVTYHSERPVANQIRYWDAYYRRLHQRLGKPVDWRLWKISPLTVDAMYAAAENRFTLFQGILQPPFFRQDAPLYANLGSLGSMVGHELGHAIDDKGVHFDARGRLRTWMGQQDSEGFHQRTQGLYRQLRQAGQNAELQIAEHIGDLVGLGFAYRAAWPSMQDARAKQQEFFRQFARNWCIVIRPGYLEVMTRTDPHPIGAARVNETLRQFPGFREAFGCPAGAPMVLPPEQQVQVW